MVVKKALHFFFLFILFITLQECTLINTPPSPADRSSANGTEQVSASANDTEDVLKSSGMVSVGGLKTYRMFLT